MQLFYSEDIGNGACLLSEEESKHCVQVLRHVKGDRIEVFDGKGGLFKALILDDHPKKCRIEVLELLEFQNKRAYYLHVAMAPTKNIDRYEWFVEKAVELGIDEITPIVCEHSERRLLKISRIEKLVMAAMKQSLNIIKPRLNDCTPFDQFISKSRKGSLFIAHCQSGDKHAFIEAIKPIDTIHILIGPEGDFSQSEIDRAVALNYLPVSLGNARLRSETAGVLAAAAAMLCKA